MLRVWCEHMDYAEIRRPSTLDLLERGGMHPIAAVRPDSPRGELAETIEAARERGLDVGLWPLLDKSDGYWPSVRNADYFCGYVDDLVTDLEDRGVSPRWVAFDMEPPFEADDTIGSSVRRAFTRGVGHMLGRSGDAAAGLPSDEEFAEAIRTFRRCLERLSRATIGSIGVTTLPVAADLGEQLHWQRTLETPWSPLPWDRAGFMGYGSMLAGCSGGLFDYEDARALHYAYLLRVHRALGSRAHVSLGITGTGVFGDEPVYEDPRELALDVSAARAAQVEDIAIFCLEGILQKARPGEWVDAIAEASAAVPPPTWRAETLMVGSSIATRLLGALFRGREIKTDLAVS